MTELLLGRLSPGRLSVGIAAGGITLVVILVLVAMALPFGCASGLSWDGSCAAKAVSPVPAAAPPNVRPTAAAPTQKSAPAGPQAPAVAQPLQSLVAATFQTLHVPPGPVAVQGGVAMPGQAKPQPDETMAKSTDLGTGPGTRKVKTIAIGPDAAMATPSSNSSGAAAKVQPAPVQAVASAPQAAAAAPVQLAPPPPADTVAPAAAAKTPVPLSPPARPSAMPRAASKAKAAGKAAPRVANRAAPIAAAPAAAAPAAAAQVAAAANGPSALLVGGTGVTVRSGPAKANPKLFPLSAGQAVTVIGSEKGWLHITDAQGRVGWAYSAYFSKSGK